jgi:hypothetical protein
VKQCTVRKKYFVLGRLEQPRQNKNLLCWHNQPNEPTKKGLLSYVLVESPFASVSTVSRRHPSLVSLATTTIPQPGVLILQSIRKLLQEANFLVQAILFLELVLP